MAWLDDFASMLYTQDLVRSVTMPSSLKTSNVISSNFVINFNFNKKDPIVTVTDEHIEKKADHVKNKFIPTMNKALTPYFFEPGSTYLLQ